MTDSEILITEIQDEILRVHSLCLLDNLLTDKTTKDNILWGTDAYSGLGTEYQKDREIKPDLITGLHSGIIKNRARKALEQQSSRTRNYAEVFTPLWVCARMNDYADEIWFEQPDVFFKDGEPSDHVVFPNDKDWERYVDSRRMEITCGEAPYLVSRYDVTTGETIPIGYRIGILDRKLRVVNENTRTEAEWLKWAVRAFQATYGYEFQGDNVLIARVNLLMTFEEYLYDRWKRKPTEEEYRTIADIIAWNLWQMDGLTGQIPYSDDEYGQISLSKWMGTDEKHTQTRCKIMDWLEDMEIGYSDIPVRGDHEMKFNFIIGNPPYNEDFENSGDNGNFAKPVYNYFMDAAYKLADRVELIHPARFLFNAGSTPKEWNNKMLNDKHFKILFYDQNGVFKNTEIKGGVVISYRDAMKDFGAIGVFIPFEELRSINDRVWKTHPESMQKIIYTQNRFNLDALYSVHPEYRKLIGSDGKDKRFRNNIFDKIPAFVEKPEADSIAVIGVIGNKRNWRYIDKAFVDTEHENLFKWKVILPRANGKGTLDDVISNPVVIAPGQGYTQTFIGLGAFDCEEEAVNLLKYVKTKFMRTMLSILKVDQHNERNTWARVPLQNFTSASDIDWSKSIQGIDRQLYAKYELNDTEIEFIETHVKEMN